MGLARGLARGHELMFTIRNLKTYTNMPIIVLLAAGQDALFWQFVALHGQLLHQTLIEGTEFVAPW